MHTYATLIIITHTIALNKPKSLFLTCVNLQLCSKQKLCSHSVPSGSREDSDWLLTLGACVVVRGLKELQHQIFTASFL